MIKVLFVCLGNICRSPTAEGIFRQLVKERGLAEKFLIDSAGTSHYHMGSSPDLRSQLEAKKHNIDISELRSRVIQTEDFALYDYILAMDKNNLSHLLEQCPKEFHYKISLLLDFHPDLNWQEVPDPYGNGGFELVFDLLQVAAENLLKHILEQNLDAI